MGGDRDLAKEMLELQLSKLPEDLKTIESSFKAKDYDTLLHCVHKLHGGLCYVGLPKLKAACAELEQALKRNKADIPETLVTKLTRLIKQCLT